ncbi:MAG TPA: TonB-dependent receptor [Candidatus Sulfotelmatobacter sp.]
MMRFIRRVLAFCLLVCIAGPAFSQSTNSGDIRGTVTDPSGAVVPGVTVTVLNLDTGTTKDLVSNSDGLYDTASILPGNYRVTFRKEGFGKLVRGPITLQVGIITVNGTLKVGKIAETVEVSADVPLLKTESAEQSTTFDSQTMVNLPQVGSSGQNWGPLAQLLPGASGTGGSMPTASGNSGDPGIAISVNGNLPFYDNFLQDGASTNLPISANVDIATFETIQELQISTSTFSAQYGIGGAVFNQITKSGSNSWHGAGYEYFQSDQLKADSYNFSSTPQPKPFLRYDDYGGAISGPIVKGKLFFYFNIDRIYDNGGSSTQTATVPTVAMTQGNFTGMPTIYDPSTPILCSGSPPVCSRTSFASENGGLNEIPATTTLDAVSLAAQKYYPAPNTPGQTPNPAFPGVVINNYAYTSPNLNPFHKWFGRVDYDQSAKNRINFSITQSDNPGTNTNFQICPVDCFSGDVDRYNTQVSDVYAFGAHLVNEFRFGYTKQGNWFIPYTAGKGYPQQLGLQYSKGDVFPSINVSQSAAASGSGASGNTAICCAAMLQPGTNAVYIENTFQPSDVVTMIRGKHILHFGGELLDYQANYTPWGNLQSGNFNFTGVYTQQNNTIGTGGSAYADFLLGDVNSWSATNQPESGMRMKSPQIFVQDDFKVRPNLTLNLGLRYEYQSGWSEVKNNLGSFDPTIPNAVSGNSGAMWFAGETSRTTLMQPKNVLLPRFGFAWSPVGTTVVRGGFGVYALTWSMDDYGQGVGVGNNSTGSASDPVGITPITQLDGPGTNNQSGQPLTYVATNRSPTAYNGTNVPYNEYNLPVGKMYQWTASVERQLGNNMEGEIAYVASHGAHLAFPADINQIPAAALAVQATQNGGAFNAANTPYPQFALIQGNLGASVSNYNSLQLQVNRRFSGGLTFNANYVWSHFLDDQDSAGWGGRGGTQDFQNSYDYAANYGNSNFDVRNALKGSLVYQLPVGKGKRFVNNNPYLDAFVGGWQTSATMVVHSGQPFTVVDANNNANADNAGSNASQYPNVMGDPRISHPTIQNWYNVAVFAQPAPSTFGDERRNQLVGPDLSEVDFSLGKNFALKEGIGLQFRIDGYNIFNHPSFGLPNTGVAFANGTPTSASSITSTTIGPRQFQLNARISF